MRIEQTAYDHQVGKRVAAREAMLQASAAVGELELKIAEQGERRNLALDLVKLRDTFRPAGASLSYLDYKFGQIATMAADYLAESQADFMAAASANVPLAFEFVRLDRADEVWMPQTRMSGGQKVRLAVATLRAIHALVMPNVGLLVLDEPTTHLDDDAVRSMAEMLKKIGDEGTLQMVVCDHNPVLIDAFSDIIKIPE
jgi:exonuclease SbcC